MITYVTGEFWEDTAPIKGIAVNLEGVAGRGQAFEAKQRSRTWYNRYKAACVAGELRVGKVLPFDVVNRSETWVSLPTKTAWRLGSNLPLIELTLEAFRDWLSIQPGNPSVALPLLGCGLGGLRPEDVQGLIYRILRYRTNTIHIYTGR